MLYVGTSRASPTLGRNDSTLFKEMVEGSLTTLTAVDLAGVTRIRDSVFLDVMGIETGEPSILLKSIELPPTLTEIGQSSFFGDIALTNVDFSKAVNLESMGMQAFYYCTCLADIDLSKNTKLTTIPERGFCGCWDEVSRYVKLPSSITSIDYKAFEDTEKLTADLSEAASVPTLGARAFDEGSALVIIIPLSKFNQFRTATNWADYAEYMIAFPIDVKWIDGDGTIKQTDRCKDKAELDTAVEDGKAKLVPSRTGPVDFTFKEWIEGDAVYTEGAESMTKEMTPVFTPYTVKWLGLDKTTLIDTTYVDENVTPAHDLPEGATCWVPAPAVLTKDATYHASTVFVDPTATLTLDVKSTVATYGTNPESWGSDCKAALCLFEATEDGDHKFTVTTPSDCYLSDIYLYTATGSNIYVGTSGGYGDVVTITHPLTAGSKYVLMLSGYSCKTTTTADVIVTKEA